MQALARYGYLQIRGLLEVRAIYLLSIAKGQAGRAAAALQAIQELEAAGVQQ